MKKVVMGAQVHEVVVLMLAKRQVISKDLIITLWTENRNDVCGTWRRCKKQREKMQEAEGEVV
jgi:hypothetical protein